MVAPKRPLRRLAYEIPEAAEMLGVSTTLVERQTAKGELRSVKFGGRLLIPAAALEEKLGLPTPEPIDPSVVEVAHRLADAVERLTEATVALCQGRLPVEDVRRLVG